MFEAHVNYSEVHPSNLVRKDLKMQTIQYLIASWSIKA